MKLYNSIGPNPKAVRMFIAEKGIEIPTVDIDLMGGENRKPAYKAINPTGQMPCLELDNGRVISEITTICEYLEEQHPNPPLIGSTAEERAETRMWTRRIDLGICEPMTSAFRYSEGLKMFESRMLVIPEAAKGLKTQAQNYLGWVNDALVGDWLCGSRFSNADIHLFCFLEFGAQVAQPISDNCTNIRAWFERVKSRPSATA